MKNKSHLLSSKNYRIDNVIDNFLRAYYFRQLNFLASDLLSKGFEPTDILQALKKAMKVCRNANVPVEKHFMPLYSDREGITIRDCKLSLLGYRLLLLNANPDHPATAKFQLEVLSQLSKQTTPLSKCYDFPPKRYK